MSKTLNKVLFGLALAALACSAVWAQALFATLTGVVTDPSGAVVANAKVTLRNAQSGDTRDTITDGSGYYSFASVPAGTYEVLVSAAGFEGFKAEGVQLGGGEERKVNAPLQIGSTGQTIEITGEADIITPEDSGEKSNVLTTEQLQNYVQVSSNAAEFIKIMPGFGNQNGTQNKSNYTGQTIGINANGDSGSQSPLNNAFSYNGLPGNTLDIVADGAHVSDPGCNCDTPVNPNSDFLQEMRVLSFSYTAEEQKGPMVITSITKAGGAQYHGDAFFTARNYVLNSNDAYYNATSVPKPADKYYYPGGSIGGPVLIPWTHFNHNHDKLFFFTGYEYFYQTIDSGVLTATVPTAGERKGDFCSDQLGVEGTAPNGRPATAPNFHSVLPQVPAGVCDLSSGYASVINPNMQSLMNLYPLPNVTGNDFNYSDAVVFQQNNWQWTTRGDWDISDNTKVFVRYNMQREQQPFPIGLWWRNGDQVPYPTPIIGKNRSDSVTGTITHVFSPTMTNETVFAYTFIGFPNVFQDPSKVNPSKVGFNQKLFYSNGATSSQIPSFGQYGPSEAAFVFNPGGFEAGGPTAGLYANKYMPSASDTLTKVWGSHTVKAGFFYEWIRNAQPANNNTNGLLQFDPTSSFSTGNAYADEVIGDISGGFSQQNFNRVNDISYNTYEFFLQDSWKITPRLSLDYGLRFTHFQPWIDDENDGYSIFSPSAYQSAYANNPNCTGSPTFCGFEWHARNSSVPLGGFATRTLFYQPRFGLAYDIFGTGKTVIRGGWGRFYYHAGQFTAGLDTSAGSGGVSFGPGQAVGGVLWLQNIPNVPAAASFSAPTAVNSRDDKQPYADSWNFSIDQKTPWRGLLEVSYVGNSSRDLPTGSGYGSNINLVQPNSITAANSSGNPGTANANLYRPYQGYGDINIVTNLLYANYNAIQATWAHQGSRTTLQLNYTYGKSLGIVQAGQTTLGNTGALYNPFNLNANYGAQPGDRRHLFNAAYSFDIGTVYHGNKFVGGFVNGWQLSGITQFESGMNLTGFVNNGNYNLALNGTGGSCAPVGGVYPTACGNAAIIPGSVSALNPTGIPLNNQSLYGTNAIQLNPIVTCNPGSGLSSHQYVNGNCFNIPTAPGQFGSTILPETFGPAFFNSDLGIFKNFKIGETKKLQLRIQAQNFLNHPLWSFPQNGPLSLSFTQQANGSFKQTNTEFGMAQYKQGQRIVELVAKFYF